MALCVVQKTASAVFFLIGVRVDGLIEMVNTINCIAA
jgi:hypothetical protein